MFLQNFLASGVTEAPKDGIKDDLTKAIKSPGEANGRNMDFREKLQKNIENNHIKHADRLNTESSLEVRSGVNESSEITSEANNSKFNALLIEPSSTTIVSSDIITSQQIPSQQIPSQQIPNNADTTDRVNSQGKILPEASSRFESKQLTIDIQAEVGQVGKVSADEVIKDNATNAAQEVITNVASENLQATTAKPAEVKSKSGQVTSATQDVNTAKQSQSKSETNGASGDAITINATDSNQTGEIKSEVNQITKASRESVTENNKTTDGSKLVSGEQPVVIPKSNNSVVVKPEVATSSTNIGTSQTQEATKVPTDAVQNINKTTEEVKLETINPDKTVKTENLRVADTTENLKVADATPRQNIDVAISQKASDENTKVHADARLTQESPKSNTSKPISAEVALNSQQSRVEVAAPTTNSGKESESNSAKFEGFKDKQVNIKATPEILLQDNKPINLDKSKAPIARLLGLGTFLPATAPVSTELGSTATQTTSSESYSTLRTDSSSLSHTPSLLNSREIPLPVHVPRNVWNQRFAEHINMLTLKGASQARIKLDPPELGPMMVRIVHGAETQIQFTVNNPIARELVDSGMQRLRELLEQQGFDQVNVDVREFKQESHTDASDQYDLDDSEIAHLSGNSDNALDEKQPIETYRESIGIIDIFA